MDDDDQSAAEAHQMELEQQARHEEEVLNRFRLLHAELNHATKDFEQFMNESNERLRRSRI